ncbi:uncharacterized protein DFL_005465 [Arthrobotrys flagrans]|uniref:BTB domain-containing protein n=1 Tax=Arthrobotrys flagrans TaxID=97331 RepID=A0A436ZY73_ARTFL|nr:hypothetical protein DFL_005465 [Arthrobotrys flagrans]
MGADLQFTNENYCQPPARNAPKATDKKQTSSAKNKNKREGEENEVEVEDGSSAENDEDEGDGDEDDEGDEDDDEDDDEDNEDDGGDGDDDDDDDDDEEEEEEDDDDDDEDEAERIYKKQALLRISNGNPTEYYGSTDLKVVLKNEHGSFSFLVSSHVLSIASKVWRRIINPGRLKPLEGEVLSGYGSVQIMTLEDDDALALDLIFQILHLQADKIPDEISFKLLRNIAIVSDKYECGRALNPWPKLWMEPYEHLATTCGYEDWIFIAKALQPKNAKVKEVSRTLVLEASSKSQCGEYFWRKVSIYSSGIEVDLKHLPDGVLAYVTRERSKTIQTMVTMLRQFVSDLVNTSQYTRGSTCCNNEACCDIAVGSLIRNLKRRGLWPLLSSDTPHEWHGSVRDLATSIKKLKMTTLVKGPLLRPSSPGTATNTVSSRGFSRAPTKRLHIKSSTERKRDAREDVTTIIYCNSPRYEHPAFENISYTGEYIPCASAFALGALITKCREIVIDISAGGYEEGA